MCIRDRQEYREGLQRDGIAEGSPEWTARMEEIQQRLDKYLKFRLYPSLPDWPVMCFYPMMKRRKPEQNWFNLPFEKRKELMAGHGRVGRKWHGKILQLITGCTGPVSYTHLDVYKRQSVDPPAR